MGDERLHNPFIRESSARDIDVFVEKVLTDLGDPEPPLSLDTVRELLKLDRQYYSSTNTGILQETVHRMKLAGKQVLAKPSRIIQVVKEWDLKALYVPETKQILIDDELADLKKRWAEAHEVGHSLIEWHEPYMHGDQKVTLSVACHEELEAEANFAAGRLLFLRDGFRDRLLAGPVDFNAIKALSKTFGNTMTTTLWRAVEAMDVPAVGLISCHPFEREDEPVRHFVRSRAFAERFGEQAAVGLFRELAKFCRPGRGPIGAGEVPLTDAFGDRHVFDFECFNNSHDTLTLGVCRRTSPVVVAVT